MLRASSVSLAARGAAAALRKQSAAAAAVTTTTNFVPTSEASPSGNSHRFLSTSPSFAPSKLSLSQQPYAFDTPQRRFFSSGPPGGGGGPQGLGSIFGTGPQSGSFLQDFTVDLTELAREQDQKQSMDPIIGRHEEIRRCLQILARRTKNNPVCHASLGPHYSRRLVVSQHN